MLQWNAWIRRVPGSNTINPRCFQSISARLFTGLVIGANEVHSMAALWCHHVPSSDPDLLLHFPGVSPQMVWLQCTGDYPGPEHQTGQMQMPLVSILVSAELCCGALRLMFPVFSNNLHWQGQEGCKGQIADVSVSLYCATVLSSYEGPILVSYQNQKCNLHPNCVHCPQL